MAAKEEQAQKYDHQNFKHLSKRYGHKYIKCFSIFGTIDFILSQAQTNPEPNKIRQFELVRRPQMNLNYVRFWFKRFDESN